MPHYFIGLLAVAGCAAGRWQTQGDPYRVAHDELAKAGRTLTAREQATFDRNGFAIIDANSTSSFHVGYAALFHHHQPVYITADSVLYAWHSSYDSILIEVETAHLIPTLRAMLGGLRDRLRTAEGDRITRADVDNYLAVALSLLDERPAAPVAGGDPELIGAIVDRTTAADALGTLKLFGSEQPFDYSMMKPRGHYEAVPELAAYFRAMSFLGRYELRIAERTKQRPWHVDRRALEGATLLGRLFSGAPRRQWAAIDSMQAALVGPADSMSLPGLERALATIEGDRSLPDDAIVDAFAEPATQRINTQLLHRDHQVLAFVLLGQRYVFDSEQLGRVVYGKLASPRLMPSPLDVAHTVFRNTAARPLLASEIARYGAEYARALDSAQPLDRELASGSLYHGWLAALRALSPDARRDAGLPAPLTGQAWAQRMMATQLASWAELRHDNLLYAKQSFTAELECEYPDAYVEPYPEFFAAMKAVAERGRAATASDGYPADRKAAVAGYFDRMAATMGRLEAMAIRERANQPLLASDLDWVNHMVSVDGRSFGCTVKVVPEGWYAELYYHRDKVLEHEPIVADVHTQPTDEAGKRIGRVLHVGTRAPRMLVVRIDHDRGRHAQTYRGFVSTYAETTTENFRRYTDSEWRDEVDKLATTPAWLAPLIAK